MCMVGILGGSFNPVHVGHIMLASYLAQYTSLDEVWLTLSPSNPLKNAEALLSDSHRLEMLHIAASDVRDVTICDIELTMPRPSYTIDTLNRLNVIYPEKKFKLIIGSDNWLIFNRWKDSENIITKYGVIIYPRPGYDVNMNLPSGVELINAPVVNLSSTFIREGLMSGKDMKAFLPSGVNNYILEKQLFKQPTNEY